MPGIGVVNSRNFIWRFHGKSISADTGRRKLKRRVREVNKSFKTAEKRDWRPNSQLKLSVNENEDVKRRAGPWGCWDALLFAGCGAAVNIL